MESRARYGRALGSVALAATLIGSGACTRPGRASAARTYIVGLRADASPDELAGERSGRDGTSVRWLMRSALRGFVASMSDDDARDLAGDSRVAFVEPDFEVSTRAVVPTGVSRVGAPANPVLRIDNVDDGDVDADVAVIDTGVDLANPGLNVAPGVTCVGGTCRAGGGDDSGHGTHVAGIIAARDRDGDGVVGVAPGARVVPVKVLGAAGAGPVSQVIAGLDWVAANADRIEVVNLSFGGAGRSRALNGAVTNLISRGVVVVVAAGNAGVDARAFEPASYPDVLTVSAVADYDGRPGGLGTPTGCGARGGDDRLATFSNYGPAIDVAAPGVCIRSLRLGGGTLVLSGTSMAAPHVAGAAALLASRSKPRDRAGVLALAQALKAAGTRDWTDTSRDGVTEPLLNVADPAVFDPVLTGTGGAAAAAAPVATPAPASGGATAPALSVNGASMLGWRLATLHWQAPAAARVTLYRNGQPLFEVPNTGSYTDLAGYGTRTARYRVCLAGTTTCSDEVPVTF